MHALLLSSLAGLATSAGGLLVLACGCSSRKSLGFMLGCAAGIMLGVTAGDLIPAAWETGGLPALFAGALLGFFCLIAIKWVMMHTASPGRDGYLRVGYFIGAAIALHDLPEGMAIAVGFVARPELGLGLALAIGLHNLPEGMATAAPLLAGGLSPMRVLAWSVIVSAFTPLGAVIGLISALSSPAAIAPLLAAAAAAMIYVVFTELVPAALRSPLWTALSGIVLGLAISLFM